MPATQAKLWNDNDYPYECMYQDKKIEIPAHKFIEGDLFYLNDIKCQYQQATWLDDTAKIQDPKSYKKLRLEILQKPDAGFTCMKCKTPLPSAKTLAVHLEEAHPSAKRVEDADEMPSPAMREAITTETPSRPSKARGT